MQANESEDYVIVDFDLKSLEGKDNLADDDSYDYCDDLNSVHSSGEHSNASDSEAENSVLSVPSGLLKELDEAHAAAKLAIPQDSEDVTTESSQSVTNSATEENNKQTSAPEQEEQKAPQPSVPVKSAPLSRISNKKRRKQMKLMKKAMAAAKASKALSEKATAMATSSSVTSTSKPVSNAKKMARKGRSKRVHPHVACAYEEIAAYHNEVQMMGPRV
ncbi:unnamed protein product [Cylindrotheca closterium]|uniref:Uncharacterized protein n=1 Tax=Cylindrotheca closterium TaxID=2856 RepID=A0AAD2CEB9_9STRA|nr:unnamed protein product [Cylindrotheca closterium]